MKRKTFVVVLVWTLVAGWANAWAADIDAGTVSTSASSNAFFSVTDYEDSDTCSTVNLVADLGYFVIKNFEIGPVLSLAYEECGDRTMQSIGFGPYLAYHWSLGEKSNLFTRIAAVYGKGDVDYDGGWENEATITMMMLEVGYEYFINPNISLGLGISGTHQRAEIESSYDGYEDESVDKANNLTTMLRFKLYF